MTMQRLHIIASIVIVALIVALVYCYVTSAGAPISGFYKAQGEFLDRSGLTSQFMYIKTDADKNGKHSMFLFIQRGEDILVNDLFESSFSGNSLDIDAGVDVKGGDTTLINNFLPTHLNIKKEFHGHKITLSDSDDKVWCILYKDVYMSEIYTPTNAPVDATRTVA